MPTNKSSLGVLNNFSENKVVLTFFFFFELRISNLGPASPYNLTSTHFFPSGTLASFQHLELACFFLPLYMPFAKKAYQIFCCLPVFINCTIFISSRKLITICICLLVNCLSPH